MLFSQGNFGEAESAYQTAIVISHQLASLAPGNVEWQLDLSETLRKLGDIHRVRGHLSEALYSYTAARAIAERVAPGGSGSSRAQAELAAGEGFSGIVLVLLDKPGEAAITLQTAREKLVVFAASAPGNTQWKIYLDGIDKILSVLTSPKIRTAPIVTPLATILPSTTRSDDGSYKKPKIPPTVRPARPKGSNLSGGSDDWKDAVRAR